jgi:hypothetical protein
MPTQSIGTIKVVVNNQDLGPINIRQGSQANTKVSTISYGEPLLIGRAVDLNKLSANTGDAITYDANTNSYLLAPITVSSANVANIAIQVFGGTF